MEFDFDSGELGGDVNAPDYTSIQTPGLSHAVKSLSFYYFNVENERWQQYQQAHESVKGIKTLSFLTWNLWFGKKYLDIRMKEIVRIIEEVDPDVIALQQATPAILRVLEKIAFIRHNYYISDADGSTINPYGVLLLGKYPFLQMTLRPLVSKTGREVMMIRLRVNKSDIWVNAAGLEPYKTGNEMRLNQARSLKITSQENSFLLLSTNHWGPVEMAELTGCFNKFNDAWVKVNPDHKGTTIDTFSNTMINKVIVEQGGVPQRRQDRADFIFYRSDTWKPISARLVGTEPVNVIKRQKSDVQGLTVEESAKQLDEKVEIVLEDGGGVIEKKKSEKKEEYCDSIFPSTHYGLYVLFGC